MSPTVSAALDVAGVSHRFGARAALSDVSIAVERGRFMALLGPNGAGKTTLFSVITRLYANQHGRVSIFGHGLDREPSRALARLGVVFQARTLDTDLTVEQNLLYHASLHGIARKAAKARIAALLTRVGLLDRRDDKVRTLSGGQSRRIEIARSLVHEPKLLLLDEPTVGLDLESRADIVAIVRALVREEGLSVLWATHIFEEIEGADDAVVLHKGRIVARGTAESSPRPARPWRRPSAASSPSRRGRPHDHDADRPPPRRSPSRPRSPSRISAASTRSAI